LIYLLLSIACSVLLGFIFKLFERYRVHTFQAIMFNYFTCLGCGWLHGGKLPFTIADREAEWMPYALLLGVVFISGFNTAALTVRYFGVTVSQVMQKMSILITVPFAILAYGESSGVAKLLGFALALCSIVLVNWPRAEQQASNCSGLGRLWIPLTTWVLAGVIEVVFVIVQHHQMTDQGDPAFITTVFSTAGILGAVACSVAWATGRMDFSWRNAAAGIVLGIPNYGSMLFLLMALGSGMEASLAFPLTNVGIILATTIGAVGLFQERLGRINWWGIALAVGAIVFISL